MEPPSPLGPRSNESSGPSSATTPFAYDSEPPLGIQHFLVWIACVAAYLGIQKTLLQQFGVPDSSSIVADAIHVGYAIGIGAAIGTLFMLVRRRRYGIPFPTHPGEFFAVQVGTCIVLEVPLYLLWFCFGESIWYTFTERYYNSLESAVMMALLCGLPQAAAVVAICVWAIKRCPQWMWRACFIAFVAGHAIEAAFRWFLPFSVVPFVPQILFNWLLQGRYVWAPFFFGALLLDAKSRYHRPWTHWLGIAIQIWIWAIFLVRSWFF